MIRHLTYIVIAKKNILTVFLFRFSRAWGGAHPLRITFFFVRLTASHDGCCVNNMKFYLAH